MVSQTPLLRNDIVYGRKDGSRLEWYCDTMLESRYVCGSAHRSSIGMASEMISQLLSCNCDQMTASSEYLEQGIWVRGHFDIDWLCYEGEDSLYAKPFSSLYNGALHRKSNKFPKNRGNYPLSGWRLPFTNILAPLAKRQSCQKRPTISKFNQ